MCSPFKLEGRILEYSETINQFVQYGFQQYWMHYYKYGCVSVVGRQKSVDSNCQAF